jgi:phage-related minor tail protein
MIKNSLVLCVVIGLLTGAILGQEKPAVSPPKQAVKTMLDYQDELGLSDDQMAEVKEALASYAAILKSQRAAVKTYETEYVELVKSDAPLPDIKSKLRQIFDARFQLRYADIFTSRRVTETLTSEQMVKWREIQARVRAVKKPK